MADFDYVPCPKCERKFMVGEEFFRLPDAYCHCPYCGNEFRVGVAAGNNPAGGAGPQTAQGQRRG